MPGADLNADIWISEYVTPWDVTLHGVTRILAAQRTEFQDMQIVETGVYGKALVLDGKWQSCTGDEFLYHEPLVQVPCVVHGAPKRVLVLGGGEGATVREALKWNTVERVTMVDIDGVVVEACKTHLEEMHQGAFDDPRTELVIGDALKYLDDSGDWDIIISDLSDPIEDGPSFPLFTREYFERVRRALAPDGVFVVQSGPVSPPSVGTHAKLRRTVEAVFEHAASYSSDIPSYPGPWSFILGASRPIGTRPDPEAIDATLRERTTGTMRMFDGEAMLGLMQLPKHVRERISEETEVFTMERPPKFFGAGVASSNA
jgi:spermidine synthase